MPASSSSAGRSRSTSGVEPTPARLLLSAATQLESLEPDLARETYLEALAAAIWETGPEGRAELDCRGQSGRRRPARRRAPRALDLVLDALAVRLTRGLRRRPRPLLTSALAAVETLDVGPTDVDRVLWLAGNRAAGIIATEVWDYDAGRRLAERQVRVARDAGALVQLQFALNFLANNVVLSGDLPRQSPLLEEDRLVSKMTGRAAHRLHRTSSSKRSEATRNERRSSSRARPRSTGRAGSSTSRATQPPCCTTASVATSARSSTPSGSSSLTCSATRRLCCPNWPRQHREQTTSLRSGVRSRGYRRVSRVTPTAWALAAEARVCAFASEGAAAEAFHRDSIGLLETTSLRVDLARGHLLYGEWLRREGRRGEARHELRLAEHMLAEMGIVAFAERARRELLATGERLRKRTTSAAGSLTTQEVHIARLVQQGLSNPEIGTRLFLSARTVEWHLRNVFGKVGISSRRQLRDVDLDAHVAAP